MTSIYLHKLLDLVGVDYEQEFVNPEIKGISFNSKDLSKGYLFLGLPGKQVDGGIYWKDALKNGAEAAIISHEAFLNSGKIKDEKVLVLPKPLNHLFGQIIAEFWNRPSDKLKMLGVTGTNGKTTITFLLEHILMKLGKNVALFGTLFNRWPGFYEISTHTTDFADKLQPKLSAATEANIEYLVMEVSSHAIDQKRISGCIFNAVIFTNLSQDHLDYHEDMESYFQTKMKLFKPPFLDEMKGFTVINIDDHWGRQLNKNLLYDPVIVSLENIRNNCKNDKYFYVSGKKFTKEGSYCMLHSNLEEMELFVPLVGEFNLMNTIQAITLVYEMGFSLRDVCNAVKTFPGVPGRMERINLNIGDLQAHCPEVIVDYAHTPDGLRKVLESIRGFSTGRIITVFGCGGNRDVKKRPIMGSIAESLSDFIFITSDNPRMEEPNKIIEDILKGIENRNKTKIYTDRFNAIKHAIDFAKSDDIVLIAGKGHEDYQIIKDRRISFDDRKIASDLLRARFT